MPGETYLPEALVGTVLYEPTERGEEARIKERLARSAGRSDAPVNVPVNVPVPEINGHAVVPRSPAPSGTGTGTGTFTGRRCGESTG